MTGDLNEANRGSVDSENASAKLSDDRMLTESLNSEVAAQVNNATDSYIDIQGTATQDQHQDTRDDQELEFALALRRGRE